MYHQIMHRTLRTLIFALVVQLMAPLSVVWAVSDAEHAHSASPSSHCLGSATHEEAKGSSTPLPLNAHHCCAVGIDMKLSLVFPVLTQAKPDGAFLPWESWLVRPDVPPPI